MNQTKRGVSSTRPPLCPSPSLSLSLRRTYVRSGDSVSRNVRSRSIKDDDGTVRSVEDLPKGRTKKSA